MTSAIVQPKPKRTRRPRQELEGTHLASQQESNQKWRATKAALGVDYINLMVPAALVEDFRTRAEEELLKYYQNLIATEPAAIPIIADLRRPTVPAVSFDVFVCEHPDFLTGGRHYKKARNLYDMFVTAIREAHSAAADAHVQKMQLLPTWTKNAARAYVMARYAALYMRKVGLLLQEAGGAEPVAAE